jgi:hypothetical protein
MLRLRPALVTVALALVVPGAGAHAQLFAAGVGVGAGIGRRNATTASDSHAHGLGWVQLGLPLFPLAVRGDALVIGKGSGGGPLALTVNAVGQFPLPIITPYVTAGWGRYGLGGDVQTRGWSAGVGVRAKLPLLPGLFGEVRRHQRLGRDLVTVGLVL